MLCVMFHPRWSSVPSKIRGRVIAPQFVTHARSRFSPVRFKNLFLSLAPSILVCTCAMLASCGGTRSQQPPPRQLIGLTVKPAIADNDVSDTVQFHATGTYDQEPVTQENVNAQWTVSPLPDGGTIADIDPVTGNATCLSAGSTVVTATAPGKAGQAQGSATLNCHSVGDFAAVVQSQGCQDWTNYDTTFQCSFPTPTTAGNSIIAFALTSGTDVPTVTDNAGHSYIQDLNYLFLGTQRVVFCSAIDVSNTETVTFTAASAVHWQAVIMEVRSLVSPSSSRDQASTNDNGYSSGGSGGPYPFTSGTVTTTQNNEMMVGWAEQAYSNALNFTFTDDPPWILVQQLPIGGSRIAYRTVNVIGTYAYTGTFSGLGAYDTGAAVITYKLVP